MDPHLACDLRLLGVDDDEIPLPLAGNLAPAPGAFRLVGDRAAAFARFEVDHRRSLASLFARGGRSFRRGLGGRGLLGGRRTGLLRSGFGFLVRLLDPLEPPERRLAHSEPDAAVARRYLGEGERHDAGADLVADLEVLLRLDADEPLVVLVDVDPVV